MNLRRFPRVELAHLPTPIEPMQNLTEHVGSARLYVKRDDCTGLAFGGNKVRQLEFYLGAAAAEGADTVLITGAVQSNFVRLTAAAARKLGMDCHIQLEERVAKSDAAYRNSGNVLLDKLLGATLHSYPDGEDEAGADRQLHEIADGLRAAGRTPYIIPLAPGHPPLGALGYVDAAREIVAQCEETGLNLDEIVVASGSGHTHAGLLFGLRALDADIRVTGVCVRRSAETQRPRIQRRCEEIAALLEMESPVRESDIHLTDAVLAPGYGRMNRATLEATKLAARTEALMLDPVYTSKAMAVFLQQARQADPEQALMLLHTGGTPAVFAYEQELSTKLAEAA
ncbi:MAG: D-cysteine desulfhydrase family protein [Methyloligellaceae bacterium]